MTMCTSGLELRLVGTLGEVLDMADIRNQCAKYMTNDTTKIGKIRQIRWWRRVHNDPDWELYLLWYNGSPIGYGIIRVKNGMRWVTGGIIEQSRGHGFGRFLFQRLTEKVTEKHCCYLEVRSDNLRAIKLYRSLGYRHIGEMRPGVYLMRADPA